MNQNQTIIQSDPSCSVRTGHISDVTVGSDFLLGDNMEGYCQCGCGEKTPIAIRNVHSRGIVKGKPIKYINHHGGRGKHWKQRVGRGRIRRYVLKIERIIGKKLPPKAVIHHRDKNRKNDDNKNLVVCESMGYHLFIHARERAYYACGDPHLRKCCICQEYDDPKSMNYRNFHTECSYRKKINMLMNEKYY